MNLLDSMCIIIMINLMIVAIHTQSVKLNQSVVPIKLNIINQPPIFLSKGICMQEIYDPYSKYIWTVQCNYWFEFIMQSTITSCIRQSCSQGSGDETRIPMQATPMFSQRHNFNLMHVYKTLKMGERIGDKASRIHEYF